MTRSVRQTALALLAGALLAAPAAAQSRSDSFNWEGAVPSGRWLMIRNMNGEVHVERGSGSQVEVRAVKRYRRGDPDEVRIQTVKARDGSVVICALWGDDGRCDEDGGYRSTNDNRGWNNRGNDVSVHFTVRVPAGVRVDASTTNGDLSVTGATSEVIAHTTNGDVRAESSGGPVSARTTNGSVTARMRELGDARDLDFATTNGSVIVEVPASLGAEVDMSTTNGHVSSDFQMTLSGRISPRRIRATIGDGSRRLRLHTTNGNVELRKSS
jgi:hypothetical protein